MSFSVVRRCTPENIDGSAVPTFATGFDWYSQGIILRPGRLSSIVEVKRIEESSHLPIA
jgi:hypothetical protein